MVTIEIHIAGVERRARNGFDSLLYQQNFRRPWMGIYITDSPWRLVALAAHPDVMAWGRNGLSVETIDVLMPRKLQQFREERIPIGLGKDVGDVAQPHRFS